MALSEKDKIRTGLRSTARVSLEDGSKILLLQNSQAELENLSSVQRAIKLLKGRVRAVVKKLRGPGSFKIKTPVGVASVRGTEFEVEFSEEGQEMAVDVLSGSVGVSKLGELADEVVLQPGERIKFGLEGVMGDPIRSGAIPLNRQDIRQEIQIASVKNGIIAQAAEESRNADYQVGKTMMDVDGKRVRIEEYIMRPAADQFKLVVLNHRDSRFDYFTYKGTFNKDLPADLSVALKEVGGKLGATAPDYYLTGYEMVMSNTKDNITDTASGGHLVQIRIDGDQYVLTNTDSSGVTTEKRVDIAAGQADGSYRVYDPLSDNFKLVTAANLTEAKKLSILDPVTDSYRDLASSDSYWKTRFNDYSYRINQTLKQTFSKKSTMSNTLAIDLDATWTNSPVTSISEYPSGTGTLYNRLSLYYQDGSKTVFDNYIINDNGDVAPASRFDGLSTSTAYKNELLKWNYQQKVKSTEMSDEINLVVDPRIGTMSGLMK